MNPKNQRSYQVPPTTKAGYRGNRPTGTGSQAHFQPFERGCFICDGPHQARMCLDWGASSEAPGRSSNKSRSAPLTAAPASVTYSEEELLKMLGECRVDLKAGFELGVEPLQTKFLMQPLVVHWIFPDEGRCSHCKSPPEDKQSYKMIAKPNL